MTEVSVVIPSRNRWPLLLDAVACALEQRDVDHDVIVVLDGSTDDSEARLAALRDPRLSLISLGRQGGVARARNAGVAASTAKWVAFLDDDDLWSPHKLDHTLSAADHGSFAYGPAIIVDSQLRTIADAPAPKPEALLTRLLVQNVMPAGSSNVLTRRDVLLESGGFDESLVHLADWDTWIRLARDGRASVSGHVDVAYVQHDLNLALTDIAGLRREVEVVRSRYADLARAHGVRLDRALFERWVATSQRRVGRNLIAARILLRSAVRDRDVGNLARAVDTLLRPEALRRARRAPEAPGWLADQPRHGFTR